jgi:hypothetical protein
MRYAKGSLVLQPWRDLPVLRRVVNSRFIAHSQLFEFMQLCRADRIRQVFNWRMRRFVCNGLIQLRRVPYVIPEPIYSITPAGALALESHGELPFAAWGYERSASDSQVPHALELNNIELALYQSPERFTWTTESQVRCLHTYSPGEFAKVYDAVINVNLGGCIARLALEYEATQKSLARYEKIRQEIESDATLDTFLYLTPSFDLLRTLTLHLCSSKKRIVFGLLSEFKKRRWDTTVYYADFVSRSLRQVLAPNAVKYPSM